eukprot:167147-Hanusia_phi.AAC.1
MACAQLSDCPRGGRLESRSDRLGHSDPSPLAAASPGLPGTALSRSRAGARVSRLDVCPAQLTRNRDPQALKRRQSSSNLSPGGTAPIRGNCRPY